MSTSPPRSNAEQQALLYIAGCASLEKLRQVARNADRSGATTVRQAARRRIYALSPTQEPGTLENPVWQSIFALEDALTDEAGATARLSRTRQKIGRDGEYKTVCDLILGKPSPGFAMLVDRGMLEYTYEAVVLRFPEHFELQVLEATKRRLADQGA